MRGTSQERSVIMTIKELTIGMEGIIDGWRWVQVEELIDKALFDQRDSLDRGSPI